MNMYEKGLEQLLENALGSSEMNNNSIRAMPRS